jgi:hypothetical protein
MKKNKLGLSCAKLRTSWGSDSVDSDNRALSAKVLLNLPTIAEPGKSRFMVVALRLVVLYTI